MELPQELVVVEVAPVAPVAAPPFRCLEMVAPASHRLFLDQKCIMLVVAVAQQKALVPQAPAVSGAAAMEMHQHLSLTMQLLILAAVEVGPDTQAADLMLELVETAVRALLS